MHGRVLYLLLDVSNKLTNLPRISSGTFLGVGHKAYEEE
jgi:hypothetical protein